MGLDPTNSGDSHNWNYSKPDKDGFSLSLTGTVKAIQEVQAMKFGANGMPTVPDFWDDGNPKMNIRMVLCGEKGGFRTWTFTPAGKDAKAGKKYSVHIALFNLAGGKSMMDLIDKTIRITTEAPPKGFAYGAGSPRPWVVELVEGVGPYQLAEPLEPIYLMPRVLANTAVSGGVMQPQTQAPVAAPQPVMHQQDGAAMSPAPPVAPAPQVAPAPAIPEDDLPF